MAQIHDKMRKQIKQMRNSTSDSHQEKHLAPVAYQMPTIHPAAPATLETSRTPEATIKHLSGGLAKFNKVGRDIHLDKGEILVSAHQPMNIHASGQLIAVQPGAIVLVNRTDEATTVRNVWESHNDSVTAYVYKHAAHLRSGEELDFGYKGSTTHALSGDPCGRRHLVDLTGENLPVASCEFSILSLIQFDNLLSPIAKATSGEDKNISEKCFKMATILNLVTARRGPYAKVNEYSE